MELIGESLLDDTLLNDDSLITDGSLDTLLDEGSLMDSLGG